MKKTVIWAVIISYKTSKELEVTLNSLRNSIEKEGLSIKVIIVDGETVFSRLEYLKKIYPSMEFIQNNDNLGVGKSFNVGIKYALSDNADYILLLNADISFNKDFIQKVFTVFRKDRRIGIVSGKVLFNTIPPKILFTTGELDQRVKSTIHIGAGEVDRGQYDHLRESEILNCPILIKREVIENVGLFREDYFMYYEDTDFYYRVRKAGYKLIVEPSAVAYTDYADENSQTPTAMRKHYYNARNLLFFIDNNFSLKEQLIAKAYIAKNTLLLVPEALFHKKKDAYYKLLGIRDYLLHRKGFRDLN